jgi:hypothetical protein
LLKAKEYFRRWCGNPEIGKTSLLDLTAAQMPEDQAAKIPDPKDCHIQLPERTR